MPQPIEEPPRKRLYYGWVLLPIAFVCYGLTFSPAYENWGFFAPEAAKELGITSAEVGAIFGMFSLWYQAASPLASYLIQRFGLRITISSGALLMAVGMWMLSYAQTKWDCYIAYALVMGTGVAISTVLPMQTLATYWFTRYRARAMAVIMAGNTAFGSILAPVNAWFVENGGWRLAWRYYAGIAVVVAIIVAIFFRNRPQEVGLHPDGITPTPGGEAAKAAGPAAADHRYPLLARDAIFTGQFLLLVLAGIAYVTAWSTFAAHGRLHMENFAFGAIVSAGVISTKNMMSTVGRLSAAVADFMAPNRLLSIALLAEGIGMAGFGFCSTPVLASTFAFLFGLGYGVSVVCLSLTIGMVCGPVLFVQTAGASRMIQGLVSAIVPIMAGVVADRTGSYSLPFLGAGLIAIVGAVGVLFCRPLSARPEESLAA